METNRPLSLGLEQIKTLLQKMGKLSDEAISLALESFHMQKDVHVQIRSISNTLLILSEEVEDHATELLALHQPMAGDLRSLKAYIKIAYDMERFGRYALDISNILTQVGPWKPYENGKLTVKEMGEETKKIVKIALNLIETRNQSLIWELSEVESNVDEFYLKNLSRLGNSKKVDPRTVLAYLLTIRYLERIADHASYIAESMTYATTGKRITLR
jgi:phosphate transport system protein